MPVAGSYAPAGGWGRPKGQLSARLSAQYDYRSQGSAKDQDLYGYLYANGRELADGRLDFYASARLHRDLDPTSATDTDPFRSLDDSHGVEEERLQQLYVDLHDRDGRLSLRGGRQYIDIADYLHLDGGQVTLFENGKFGGGAYLGQPVSYYTSVSGDLAGGISLLGRPWEGNLTRLTFARYYEDQQGAGDQNYFLDFRQKLTEEARVRSQLSFLNGDYRMGSLDGFYLSKDGETDLSLGASYWGTFDARTRAYSPLYNVLGAQQPYTYAYTRLTQQLTPTFALSPGVSLRFAEGGGNDFNNRDYGNYDLSFIYAPVRSVSGSISLQYWNVEHGDSFVGVSWDVRYRHRRLWEVSAGTSYAQYSYDTVSDISYSVNGGQTVFSENGTVVEKTPYV